MKAEKKLLSNKEAKLLASLAQKKYREKYELFIVEGQKAILDFLNSGMQAAKILVEKETDFPVKAEAEIVAASAKQLKKISSLSKHNGIIGLFKIPKPPKKNIAFPGKTLLYFDGIRNPGNFGTLIRTADWFGIPKIICSPDSVDVYNPKVVQASMGSIARVEMAYAQPSEFLKQAAEQHIPIYGTFADGKNIYALEKLPPGIIIMGNEGRGIRPEAEKYIGHRISIPRFGKSSKPESLNVSVAGALVISEFMRRKI